MNAQNVLAMPKNVFHPKHTGKHSLSYILNSFHTLQNWSRPFSTNHSMISLDWEWNPNKFISGNIEVFKTWKKLYRDARWKDSIQSFKNADWSLMALAMRNSPCYTKFVCGMYSKVTGYMLQNVTFLTICNA